MNWLLRATEQAPIVQITTHQMTPFLHAPLVVRRKVWKQIELRSLRKLF